MLLIKPSVLGKMYLVMNFHIYQLKNKYKLTVSALLSALCEMFLIKPYSRFFIIYRRFLVVAYEKHWQLHETTQNCRRNKSTYALIR